ncbi:hypothetical protein C0J52_05517 [Blattella germanica]|nr:hypothetical protein C0J52_05517 [Blattella germanica]
MSSGDSPVTWPMWTPIMAAQQGDPFKAQRHFAAAAAFHHEPPDVSSTAAHHPHQVMIMRSGMMALKMRRRKEALERLR